MALLPALLAAVLIACSSGESAPERTSSSEAPVIVTRRYLQQAPAQDRFLIERLASSGTCAALAEKLQLPSCTRSAWLYRFALAVSVRDGVSGIVTARYNGLSRTRLIEAACQAWLFGDGDDAPTLTSWQPPPPPTRAQDANNAEVPSLWPRGYRWSRDWQALSYFNANGATPAQDDDEAGAPDGSVRIQNLETTPSFVGVTPASMPGSEFDAWGLVFQRPYLKYPPSVDLYKLLSRWQFGASLVKDVNALSWVMQTCWAIHPFEDGNGRTCRMYAIYKSRRIGIMPPLQYAPQFYQKDTTFAADFAEGSRYHEYLISRLRRLECRHCGEPFGTGLDMSVLQRIDAEYGGGALQPVR